MTPLPMTDKDPSRQTLLCLSRRNLLSGMASLGMLASGPVRRAVAQKRVPIPEGDFVPLPIAIPNFTPGTPPDGEVSVGVTQVITKNLKRSGLFAPIDQAAYIEKTVNIGAVPQFEYWRTIGAQALAIGRMTRQADGRLEARFRLWDVATGQQLIGQQYFTSPENWRRIAHIISDQVYTRLTGETGYFDSRVAFVHETSDRQRRVKRLALMDQDGANVYALKLGRCRSQAVDDGNRRKEGRGTKVPRPLSFPIRRLIG
jgi:TolB protein